MWGGEVPRREQGTAVSTCKVPEAQVATPRGAQTIGSTPLEKAAFSPSRLAGSMPYHAVGSFFDHYIPPRTPLFMAPLSLSIQSSPTFKAWLMGDRIANRKSLHADGPGF